GRLLEKAYDFTVSAEKVGGVVDLELEQVSLGERLPSGQTGKRVAVSEVQVAMSRGLTFTVPASGRVAVVEPHGATRHLLAQVLAGHDLPDTGSIELDGVDTRRADLHELRSRVALVRPSGLFEGTLYENVAVGRPTVGPDQARAALHKVGLVDVLKGLPEGLETPLSAAGHPLSLDQQVQVLVARAIAGKPRLIVVDDFFDALSPPAREACVKAVAESGDHTLVAVCSEASSELCKRCVRAEEQR
ncbi:MAG: ABC transporter ATP-binding protein, partial [Myxococcaceae bacterium]|nr:ABC transporter ATP-binding protein [Myxococcaceae bacterium]